MWKGVLRIWALSKMDPTMVALSRTVLFEHLYA